MRSPASGRTSERVGVRFGMTFLANALRAGLSFVGGLLIARTLGAADYGDLSFLLASFTAIGSLLDMGSSSAFYTLVSRRCRGPALFALYGGWLVVQFAATLLAIGVLLPGPAITYIWVSQQRSAVLLAFASSFLMTQLWGTVSCLGEAVRKTVMVQVASVLQAAGHLLLLGLAAAGGWLTVHSVLWLLLGEHLLLSVVLGPRLLRANLAGTPEARDGVREILRTVVAYCAPLVVYGWASFLYTFADRWLLQQLGGAAQQGFFSIAQQFANVSLIATTSILRVLWKEVAEAQERRDYQRVRTLYSTVSRCLYFTGAWVSCLVVPYTSILLAWTAGPQYAGAAVALGLMLLYPLHQSLGQILATLFYATGNTRPYVRINLILTGVSLPLTYLLLAAPSAAIPGLGLGAEGLALKMIVLQVIGVNLQGAVLARRGDVPHAYGYQLVVPALLLGVAWTSRGVAEAFVSPISPSLAGVSALLVGVCLYTVTSAVLVWRQPDLVGLTGELREVITGSIITPSPLGRSAGSPR